MSCGCNAKQTTDGVRRSRAAMCCVCRWGGWNARTCRRDGASVSLRVRGKDATCPRGWHTTDGLVRWMGLRWYGVPYPVRVVLAVLAESPHVSVKAAEFDGCGCVKALKDAVNDATLMPDQEAQ